MTMKQERKATPQPSADEVLRRMLASPPEPRIQKPKKKAKKRPK